MVTDDCTRLAQGDDLCVCGRIIVGLVAVRPPGNDTAVADDYCTHGHFSDFQRALRRAQSLLHEEFIGLVAGLRSVVAQGGVETSRQASMSILSRSPLRMR